MYIVHDNFFLPRAQIDVDKYKLNVKSCHQKVNVPLKQIHQRTKKYLNFLAYFLFSHS